MRFAASCKNTFSVYMSTVKRMVDDLTYTRGSGGGVARLASDGVIDVPFAGEVGFAITSSRTCCETRRHS